MKPENLIHKDLKNLYKTDYLAWYETTLKIVRSRRLDGLDLDSLSEVLENLVRDTKRSSYFVCPLNPPILGDFHFLWLPQVKECRGEAFGE